VFGIVLITACTVMQVYVLWRAASTPLMARPVPRRVLFGICVGLWAIFVLAHVFGHDSTGDLSTALELIGMTWMAMLFLASVALLAVDLVTGFGFWMRRQAPVLRACALGAGAALSAIALLQGLRPPVVQRYEVTLPELPKELDGTVLVAMSDMHLGSLLGERWLAARVAQVQAEQPDLVVLLGDVVEGHGPPPDRLRLVLRGISAPLGQWAVAGNHESHGGNDAGMRLLEEAGFRVLHNRWAEVRPGLVLAGVDDFTSAHRLPGAGDDFIPRALAGRPPGAVILLSHTPWHAEQAAESGVGLMLSGHTHGGQIWPFGWLVGTRYPLLGGRYEADGMPVIVGRGTGTWGPRMRLWRPSEILRITLRRAGGRFKDRFLTPVCCVDQVINVIFKVGSLLETVAARQLRGLQVPFH